MTSGSFRGWLPRLNCTRKGMPSNLLSLVLFVVCAGAALSQTAPVISTPPANQPVKAGQTATFSVVASGSSPLSYQWYRNGVKIAGATETSYRISSAGISDVGQYTVRVANAYGAVWSGSVQGQVATAGPTSYFLGLDNSLYTMGENLQFQQTDQLYKQTAVPTVIATDVARVAAGFWEVHFIKTDGTLWGVGRNRGAFGLPTTSSTKHKTTPYLIESNVVESSIGNAGAGVSTHALYLKSDGTLWGMGQNSQGQLGDRSNTRRDSPIQIATGVRSIATGTNHSMFLTNDGTVWLMGDNSSGQLGDGTTISRNEPFKLRGGVAQIACAGNSSYLVTVDGALFSWGANQNGQLGLGDTQPRVTPVQLVATGVLEVFAGGHSYGYDPYCSAGFLRDDGMVYVMGYNGGGQLGDGSKIQRNAPVSVASGISSVAFGFFDYAHALFVSSSGNLLGSGVSDRGQLGRGFTNYAQEPRLFLSSGVDKKRISTGQFGGAFYINAKNELFACGGNTYGALGLGDAVPRPNWTKVADDVWGVSSGNADVVWWKNDANKSLYGAGFNITPGNKTPILLATQVESASWGSDFGCYIKSDKALSRSE